MLKNTIPVIEERQITNAVEDIAKQSISNIIARKAELKDKKSQLNNLFLQDLEYANLIKVSKDLAKQKTSVKKRVMQNPEVNKLALEIKELSGVLKDTQLSLFDYLKVYTEKTGNSEIVDLTGQTHEIEIIAKIKI